MTTPADMGILTGEGLLMPGLAEEMQAEAVAIEGGTFNMGAEYLTEDERPVHPVSVSSFRIGRFAVTNKHFATFAETLGRLRHVLIAEDPGTNMAKVLARAEDPRVFDQFSIDDIAEHFFKAGSRITLGALKTFIGGFQTFEIPSFSPRRGFDGPKQPVVEVSWYDLLALAAAVGGRLPTEAEWEYAATGPKHDAKYGTQSGNLNPEEAHYDAKSTADVGSYPANRYGLYDMAGNVWQWVMDWFGPYTADSLVDPTGPVSGESRVLRGGSWYYLDERYLRAAYRNYYLPGVRFNYFGGRVLWPQDSRK